MFYSILPLILSLITAAQAHMELSWPPPFRSRYNPHAVPSKVDYSMTTPLKAGGADFPCKGYHVDMDDATGGGAPVVTWSPGSAYNFTVVGGAPHNGGSCQAALSYDKGKKFTVIHSFMGDCPLMTTGNFKFSVPSDAKPGSAIFAWSWLNQVGNREYYMNCASVNIASSSSEYSENTQIPFSERPDLFVANLGNGCTTVEGKDTIYPHPGPDITSKYDKSDDSGSLKGNCDSGAKSRRSLSEINTIDEPLNETRIDNLGSFSRFNVDGSMSEDSNCPFPEIKASADGQCGGSQTCSGSMFGSCCSRFGFCGNSRLHCGFGCMSEFGKCASDTGSFNEPNGTDINEPSNTDPFEPSGTGFDMPSSASLEIPHGTSMSQPNQPDPKVPYSTGFNMPFSTGVAQPNQLGPKMPFGTDLSQPSSVSFEMPYGTGLSQPHQPDPMIPYGTGVSQPSSVSFEMPYGTGLSQPHQPDPMIPYGTGVSQPSSVSFETPYSTGLSQPHQPDPMIPYGTGMSQPSSVSFEMPYGTALSQPNQPDPIIPFETGINIPFITGAGQPHKTGPKMPSGTSFSSPFGTSIGQPGKPGPKLPFGTGINFPFPFPFPFSAGNSQPTKTGPKMPFGTGSSNNMPFSISPNMPHETGTTEPSSTSSDTPTSTETGELSSTSSELPTQTEMSEPSTTCLHDSDSTGMSESINIDFNKYTGTIPRYRSRSIRSGSI